MSEGFFSRGFRGRRRSQDTALPPGQYLVDGFPVLSAGPTPRVPVDRWEFTITGETGVGVLMSAGDLERVDELLAQQPHRRRAQNHHALIVKPDDAFFRPEIQQLGELQLLQVHSGQG